MFAVIRIRGSIKVQKKINDALEIIRLHRVNHMVLIDEKSRKMIERGKDYITFGEIDEGVLAKVLEKWGRLPGRKRLDAEFLKEKGFKDFAEMANAIIEGKKKIKDLEIKPVFRLHPPRKGFERKGIKKSYSIGGVLGYRGKEINKLILKMI
ncbi:MAG: 50S ribosomal protein L30 [Candidatus Diapherotrites archaeon]